ncbi:unnamed protein product [Microthlaspi erraticum]|uniref:Uncharacterized protein n=1 Tax=Microthlaspi erraticum TaxID=1685480 RepID=A0A6D2KVC9_9BRAS|nr:unnamed protein product [Microthlaspi erraticum]
MLGKTFACNQSLTQAVQETVNKKKKKDCPETKRPSSSYIFKGIEREGDRIRQDFIHFIRYENTRKKRIQGNITTTYYYTRRQILAV